MKARVNTTPTRPTYRPEPEGTPATADLFAVVAVITEHSLLERLKQLGADVYCEGEFETLNDRLRHVIEREKLATAVSGRNPMGKVESVAQAFERVTGAPLVPKRGRKDAVSVANKAQAKNPESEVRT